MDTKLVVAECRAGDLLACLQAALNGESHWRPKAKKLLWEIDLLAIPEPRIEWLREVDDRKRRAECDVPSLAH